MKSVAMTVWVKLTSEFPKQNEKNVDQKHLCIR